MEKRSRFTTALAVTLCGASWIVAPAAHAQTPVSTLSHGDTSFVKDASEGSMDEIKLGEIAQQNGANERVKSFAQKMVNDHTKLNDELQSLASRKSVSLPTDISITQKASNKLLSSKTGASFDKSYMSSMVKDHKDDIQAFEKEANSGVDPDVRNFATKALPTLREHLQLAESIATQVGANQ